MNKKLNNYNYDYGKYNNNKRIFRNKDNYSSQYKQLKNKDNIDNDDYYFNFNKNIKLKNDYFDNHNYKVKEKHVIKFSFE